MTSLKTVYWFKAFYQSKKDTKKKKKALSYTISSNFLDSEKRSAKIPCNMVFKRKEKMFDAHRYYVLRCKIILKK